jgi:hypothetical protein
MRLASNRVALAALIVGGLSLAPPAHASPVGSRRTFELKDGTTVRFTYTPYRPPVLLSAATAAPDPVLEVALATDRLRAAGDIAGAARLTLDPATTKAELEAYLARLGSLERLKQKFAANLTRGLVATGVVSIGQGRMLLLNDPADGRTARIYVCRHGECLEDGGFTTAESKALGEIFGALQEQRLKL